MTVTSSPLTTVQSAGLTWHLQPRHHREAWRHYIAATADGCELHAQGMDRRALWCWVLVQTHPTPEIGRKVIARGCVNRYMRRREPIESLLARVVGVYLAEGWERAA